jgi:hypothetical protein
VDPEQDIVVVDATSDGDRTTTEQRMAAADLTFQLYFQPRLCRLPRLQPIDGPDLGWNFRRHALLGAIAGNRSRRLEWITSFSNKRWLPGLHRYGDSNR